MARAKKPTALKVIQGNPGKRAMPKDEPKPPVPSKVPAPPVGLSKEAGKQWRVVVKHLINARVFTVMDEQALMLYCEAYTQWIESQKKLRTEGSIIMSPNGYPMPSPWIGINNKSFDKMHKMLTEFGMTPSSRTKVKTAPTEDDNDDGFDDL